MFIGCLTSLFYVAKNVSVCKPLLQSYGELTLRRGQPVWISLWNPLLFFCVSVTMEMFALHLKGHNKKECKGSEALPWHTLLFSYKTSGLKYHLVWLLLFFFYQGFILIIHVKKMKRICWYVACVHVVGFSHTKMGTGRKMGYIHLFTTSAYTETEIQQPHSCCLLRSVLLHLCCVLYCF